MDRAVALFSGITVLVERGLRFFFYSVCRNRIMCEYELHINCIKWLPNRTTTTRNRDGPTETMLRVRKCQCARVLPCNCQNQLMNTHRIYTCTDGETDKCGGAAAVAAAVWVCIIHTYIVHGIWAIDRIDGDRTGIWMKFLNELIFISIGKWPS